MRFNPKGCSPPWNWGMKKSICDEDWCVPDTHRFFCWMDDYVLKIKDLSQWEMVAVTASIHPQVCHFPMFSRYHFKISLLQRMTALDQQIKTEIKELLIPFCSASCSTFINMVTTWHHPSNQVLHFHFFSLIQQPLKSTQSHHYNSVCCYCKS